MYLSPWLQPFQFSIVFPLVMSLDRPRSWGIPPARWGSRPRRTAVFSGGQRVATKGKPRSWPFHLHLQTDVNYVLIQDIDLMFENIYIYICICIYVCICIYIDRYRYMYAYAYVYIYMYVYMCVCAFKFYLSIKLHMTCIHIKLQI